MSKFHPGDWVEVIETSEVGRVVRRSRYGLHVQIGDGEDLFKTHQLQRASIKSSSLYMAVDPLIKAAKKAYRGSTQYALDQLLAEESRWKRKVTIASNKLSDVRDRINRLAREMASKEVAP